MNGMTGCQYIRQLLGVYVLGAIDPAERAQVDAHLAGCAECREELAGLAGLPALLGRVPFGEAARISGFEPGGPVPGDDPGAEPLTGVGEPADVVPLTPLLNRMAQRRRANRWRGVLAAAAVALIAAGATLGLTHHSGPAPAFAGGPVSWQTAQGTDPGTHAKVVVKYAGQPWGTSLDAEVYGIQAGTTCKFWVLGRDGRKWQAGSWTVASTWSDTWYPASTSVPVSAVRGFEITSGQRVLVHMDTT